MRKSIIFEEDASVIFFFPFASGDSHSYVIHWSLVIPPILVKDPEIFR